MSHSFPGTNAAPDAKGMWRKVTSVLLNTFTILQTIQCVTNVSIPAHPKTFQRGKTSVGQQSKLSQAHRNWIPPLSKWLGDIGCLRFKDAPASWKKELNYSQQFFHRPITSCFVLGRKCLTPILTNYPILRKRPLTVGK